MLLITITSLKRTYFKSGANIKGLFKDILVNFVNIKRNSPWKKGLPALVFY